MTAGSACPSTVSVLQPRSGCRQALAASASPCGSDHPTRVAVTGPRSFRAAGVRCPLGEPTMSNLRIVTILRTIVASAVVAPAALAQDFVRVAAPTEMAARATTMPVGEHLEYDVR